ncbi:hypothetical protein [Deinococcus peraridilitoris]|uniref:Uncharacterized protein n=1 Tax=Deinococcus peraridilitoris (strain DSM 19664 / LMG 22246 / CIP 109416 / KR-200) TaxID=937777 RepID=K9ZYT9_DEIPD|nr:hypothetical protein [Deinococcus peraridilitoris]AFZ66082.1 hypothetical protein Deipe_0486 [Deinococcus peraridilitoris DSM 19664]
MTLTLPERLSARLYAEFWYRALRTWDVREVKTPSAYSLSTSYHYEREFDTLGQCGPERVTYLRTPIGEYTEREVGRQISLMVRYGTPETVQLGRMLERIRGDVAPQSLVREGGRWITPTERAVRYGVAVLTLAVRLRDGSAESALNILQNELAVKAG